MGFGRALFKKKFFQLEDMLGNKKFSLSDSSTGKKVNFWGKNFNFYK